MTRIIERKAPTRATMMLEQQGVPPLLARLYAARGIVEAQALDNSLALLLPPAQLLGADTAAALLADAIAEKRRLLIVADYDCDGATACAVGLRALRSFGAQVSYLVPNRFEYGYGLTPEIVHLAAGATPRPDILITVDNGIASVEGVAAAARLGMTTLITDHHLPGEELPAAAVIVNPNQPGCDFPSKALAGVGVMFYVMLALRAELRRRGAFGERPEPKLDGLLDLVALGTVADVVPLDRNNRILVAQGIARIRAGRMQAGIAALMRSAGRDAGGASTFDLGFTVGPRLNAAGRLSDMSVGIECLITDDPGRALNIASQLDALNRERRLIESSMKEEALLQLTEIAADDRASLCLFDANWHQGVIGILAARLRERLHRPSFAFAPGAAGELKGSGRSIPGLHLRDALDLLAKRHPGLLLRFGGHAAAAGVSIAAADFGRFADALEEVASALIAPADLTRSIATDGALENAHMSLAWARQLEAQIWGQGFPPPLFSDRFEVLSQRILKDKHLKLHLAKNGARFEAIQFNFGEAVPAQIHCAYRLGVNSYRGVDSVQLLLEHCEAA